ncbi:alpha-ketoacid dehydrogenase subunit beta [Pseudonocardia acaciae]|uniref:alpha-ketoacid dehydrogenase subunit beta n=1 Tax=Pseudonocardia acaciae TaxID=551276 RepID=UPI000490EF0A|nr:alpha-ketoacid dehydrogenase subunit beta [Pseudonocardia acaciae]
MSRVKYWQAVNSALREELARDQRVHLFGEDVGAPGGPFGATRNLQAEFGEWRVRDTPISEGVITGLAVGSAMAGLRPVAEIMYFDFMTLAMDQLVNQAAKMRYMSAGGFSVPLTIRTLCGAGRGSGPQHSQSLEAWLASVPGLKVVWGGTPADAKGLLKSAIRDDDPVVVIESVSQWTQRGEVPDDPEALVPIGAGLVRRSGQDLTLVCWGGTVARAVAAAETLADEHGVDAEVLDLRTLSPLDRPLILGSLNKTGRLVVVQDATGPCSIGSEVVRLAATEGFGSLRAPAVLLSAPFAPVPFPPGLEREYYPQADDLVAAVLAALERTPA